MFDALMLLGFYLLIGLAFESKTADETDTPGMTFALMAAWPLFIVGAVTIELESALIILVDRLVEWAYGEREE